MTSDIESDSVPTTVKVPYESRNAMVCLPCVEQDYYKDLGAVDQIRYKINEYRRELGAQGLVRPEFFDLMKKSVVEPKPKKFTSDGTSFLCAHNICGFFHPDDCVDYPNCCHHIYRLKMDTAIPSAALLQSFFFKTSDGGSLEKSPVLKFKWHQIVSLKSVDDMKYTNKVTGWLRSIKEHFVKEHEKIPFPPAIQSVKAQNKGFAEKKYLCEIGFNKNVRSKF